MGEKLFATGLIAIIASVAPLDLYFLSSGPKVVFVSLAAALFFLGLVLIFIGRRLIRKTVDAQAHIAFVTLSNVDREKLKNSMRFRALPAGGLLCKLFFSPDHSERIVFYKAFERDETIWVAKQKLLLYNRENMSRTGTAGVWNFQSHIHYPSMEIALKESLAGEEKYYEESPFDRDREKSRRLYILRRKTLTGYLRTANLCFDGMYGNLSNGCGIALEIDFGIHILKVGSTTMVIGSSEDDAVVCISPLPSLKTYGIYHSPWKFEKVNEYGKGVSIKDSEYIFGL